MARDPGAAERAGGRGDDGDADLDGGEEAFGIAAQIVDDAGAALSFLDELLQPGAIDLHHGDLGPARIPFTMTRTKMMPRLEDHLQALVTWPEDARSALRHGPEPRRRLSAAEPYGTGDAPKHAGSIREPHTRAGRSDTVTSGVRR